MSEPANAPHPGGRALKGLVAVALLAYPAAIYFLHHVLSPSQMLAGLLILLGLRALVSAWLLPRHTRWQLALGGVLILAGAVVLQVFRDVRMDWLRLYPMLLDLGVAALFLGSLASGRPLVERIARLTKPDLPAQGVIYTRRITWAWGVLMVLIAMASLYTATAGSLALWTLFNGVLVYVIIVAAFAMEYALRCRLRRRWRDTTHERSA